MMFLEKQMDFRVYKKVLVVGAGSGSDILTSLMVAHRLMSHGSTVDLAGFLTPWALHSFDGQLEQPVNRLKSEDTRKYFAQSPDVSLDFFEPTLFVLNKQENWGINGIYLFSIQYGTQRLQTDVAQLMAQQEYDAVFIVDVGGDILARKQDLPRVFTPIVDKTCLQIFSQIYTQAEKILAVIAPGVDGELPREILREVFDDYSEHEYICAREAIEETGPSYQFFRHALVRLQEGRSFHSNTIRLIHALVTGDATTESPFQKQIVMHERKWVVEFPISLDLDLVRNIYYLSLDDVQAAARVSAQYTNVTEAFLLFKSLGVGGTEVDLKYVPRDIAHGSHELNFLLHVMNRMSHDQRVEIETYIATHIPKHMIVA